VHGVLVPENPTPPQMHAPEIQVRLLGVRLLTTAFPHLATVQILSWNLPCMKRRYVHASLRANKLVVQDEARASKGRALLTHRRCGTIARPPAGEPGQGAPKTALNQTLGRLLGLRHHDLPRWIPGGTRRQTGLSWTFFRSSALCISRDPNSHLNLTSLPLSTWELFSACLELFFRFLHLLAQITPEQLLRDGFSEGGPRRFQCLIGLLDGIPVAYALYFFIYSTWEGLSLYLEGQITGVYLGPNVPTLRAA